MQNKSYKYENIQIGNFLISIGYYLNELKYKHPVSFNLHQQTPNDFTIGDLFGKFSGKFFIIEFKNSQESLKTELKKRQRVKLISRLNNDFKEYTNLSIMGHLICYPTFNNQEMEFNLEPYVTIQNEKFSRYKINNCKDFLLNIIDKKSIGIEFNEIEKYIELLKKCSAEDGNKNIEGVSSGIFLNFEKEKGIAHINSRFLNLRREIRLEVGIAVGTLTVLRDI